MAKKKTSKVAPKKALKKSAMKKTVGGLADNENVYVRPVKKPRPS